MDRNHSLHQDTLFWSSVHVTKYKMNNHSYIWQNLTHHAPKNVSGRRQCQNAKHEWHFCVCRKHVRSWALAMHSLTRTNIPSTDQTSFVTLLFEDSNNWNKLFCVENLARSTGTLDGEVQASGIIFHYCYSCELRHARGLHQYLLINRVRYVL